MGINYSISGLTTATFDYLKIMMTIDVNKTSKSLKIISD